MTSNVPLMLLQCSVSVQHNSYDGGFTAMVGCCSYGGVLQLYGGALQLYGGALQLRMWWGLTMVGCYSFLVGCYNYMVGCYSYMVGCFFYYYLFIYCFTAQVLKVCRTPGPTACSRAKMVQLNKVCYSYGGVLQLYGRVLQLYAGVLQWWGDTAMVDPLDTIM